MTVSALAAPMYFCKLFAPTPKYLRPLNCSGSFGLKTNLNSLLSVMSLFFFRVKLLFDVVLHSHGLTTVGFLLLHYHPYVKERFTRLLCISFLSLFVEIWSASRVPT